jgi:uncharacterized RDD family membrane protein YckC
MSETPTPESNVQPELLLAKWSDRFFAWLIDFVIVQVALGIVFAAAAFPFWFDEFSRADRFLGPGVFDGPWKYLLTSSVFFAYWTFFESSKGQSIGKMLLKLKTVNLTGGPIDTRSAAIQSFGKAFLLPIDVILGWIFTNDKRQRIFNKVSDTLVIKDRSSDKIHPDMSYRKD